jgi:hypothetical protein
MTLYFSRLVPALLLGAVLLVGCGPGESQVPENGSPAADLKYLLTTEPAGAQDVKEALDSAQDGDEVVVVGRVGGEMEPWVPGLAAFNVADLSLKPCNEIEGDNCPTPWDYCCEPDLAAKRTLVKVVDAGGKVVATDAKQLLNLTELQTVVIQGTARRDDAGNLSLLATGIYVRP